MSRAVFARETLVDVAARHAAEFCGRSAFRCIDGAGREAASITFGELDARARSIGGWLQDRIAPSDRVLLLFPSGIDFISAFLGCLYAGAIAVPATPPRLRGRGADRLANIVRDAEPSLALVASGTPEQFGVQTEAISGIGSQWAEAWRRPSLSSDDIAFLQYTSGSTTTPRGVMITHRNLMANEDAIQRAFGVRTDSIICGWLPLHHDMGLIGCILQPVYSAAACILMSPESFVQRPARWLKCISQYRAHISGAPDTAYGLCADKIAPREIDEMDLSAWRVAFNGAEPVRAATMQRFNERFARAGFQPSAWRPCYGLAESTLLVTVTSQSSGPARIEIGRPEGGDVLARVSCGTPPEVDSSDLSSEVLIVDPAERQRKAGEEIGEVWLRGPSVAAGYWRRDAETAETFRATLVGGEDHYLRTGDLGLFRSGELFLVGRQKDLIILNGRNLYPQDIESTVEQCHRAIRTGAVAAVGVEANGREELAIVCELDGRLATDRKAILSAIRSSVAREHEATPCSITFVDRGRLPRTTSGKIRRYACCELALDAMRQSRDGLQDSDLIGEVARVLGVPAADVSLDRPLTELGLDSIRAIEVAHCMERFAGVRISPASLLEGAPVGLLISSGLPASAPASRAESVRYPLSVNQEALYRAEQTSPGDSGHQLVAAAMVHGKVDERAIRDALATLASRYDALRIRIVMEGQTPLQEAVNAIAIPLQEVDASELSPEGLAELMRRRILEPIGLDSAPLWRVDLYRISANAAALLLRIHHIVADHWSVSGWFDDFVRLLGGGELERGAPVQGYEAFVTWQHDWFSTDESRQAEEYWSRKLEAEVPPVRFASRESSTVHSTVRRLLAARLTDRVHELCRQCEITPFAIYSAIYSILLSRHASQAKLRFGTPAAVRSAAFAESVFGYLVNPIPIEADTGPDRSFRDFAVALHHEVADGIRHANHPMLRMKSAGAEPVFNTVLTMQPSRGPHGSDFNHFVLGFNGAAIESGQLRFESMAIDPGPPEYDAILMLAECERGLLARLQLKAGAGSGELAERLLSDFERLLEQAVGHPNVCIHSVSLVTAGELLELQTLRESEPPRPKRDCLHRWFEEEVRLFPDRAAVSADDETLTYKDLNRRANQLARYLRERGLGAECLIALYLGRTPATVSAILGVLKSGAAYVPLDPAYPAERVRYILKDSGCKLVITESGPQEALSADAGTDAVCLNSIRQECNHYPDDNPDWEVVSGNAAYVIYTSGSTGTPKGCVVTHANVTRLFAASESLFHFSESDVWSVFHSFAFDFSVWELWGALLYGGRAVIVPHWVSRSPDEFLRLLRDERVTMASQTPSAFRELAKLSSTALSVRAVVFGGEELPFSILRPWMCGAQPQFINMYGITETTVHVTYRPVEAAEAVALHTGSMIGRALPDMELYVLDSHMQAVPPGVTGELYAGGAGLARGYLNRPALTAERFLPNPFSREPGARLYRTGDIGRYTLSGDVEYLGRQDRQVQIRGHRVELGEIEAALNRHAKVARAVVEPRQVLRRRLSFRGAPADSYEMRVDSFRRYIKEPILRTAEESTSVQIVAYFCAEQDAPSVEDLRAYLNDLLPTYMLPSAFEQLAELPLMPSGKLDRARLPETAVPNENLALPRTAVESELAAIWAEELDLPQVGVRDNFFAIGGDSLRAIRISARAAQRGLNICVADVYRHPTIEEVAAAGAPDGRRAEPFRIAEPFSQLALGDLPLLPAGATDAYPLCRMQSGLIFHSEQHLGSSVYRATFLYHLRGPLSADHICSAVEEVIRRYGVLRTSFDLVRFSEPLQIVHSEVPTPLTVIDLSHLTGEDQEAALVEWFEEERVRDFDLQKPPLCRFAVHRLSDDRFTLGLTCHDAILDGWSTSLLLGEVLTESWKRYSGKQTSDPGSRVSYGDFVAAERTASQSQESRRFWEQQLAEWTCVRIPGRCDRSCDATPRMAVLDVEIPEALSHSLSELTRAEGLPLKALLLAVHLRVLQVLSGCVDVTTGLEANGRLEVAGGDRSVGQHLNTVPFRLRLDGGSWLDLARKVLAAEQELLPHRRFPYAEIQKLSGTRSLYETTFNYTHFHVLEGLAELEGLEIEGGRGRELTHYALKTELNRDAFTKCLHLDVIYDANGLDQMQILEIGRRYRRALDAIAANPHSRYDAADLLGAEERQTLIRSWNNTAAPVPARCLHELIEEMAGASPDRPATEYQGQQLTYRELSRRANRLARELQRLGARPEMLVGVYMERSLQLMVALLAILKAGAAYVPLDPEYPAERIAYMSEDADLELVLTQQHLSSRAPGRTVLTVSLSDDVTPDDDTDLGTAVEPLNAAYIIYTSGSTGRPKGAINTHQAIVNRLLWMRDAYHVDGSDRILQKTPISFDVSVWELFLPLICGATVVLARPGEHRDAASLVATLRNSRITTVHFVPSMLRLLFDEDLRRLPALRRVICSGEELTADLAVQFFQRFKAELHNLYGPTEAAVDVSAWPCDPAAKDGSVPIGRPITNVQLLVLDPAMHPCAVGVPGELFIGGICLARGYQARPGLTAERFCPNPYGLSLGERLYRTGDLAARRGDGSIEFLGRIDNQVKINGVRIEPGEIERTLLQHPAIVQAAVVPIATSGQHKQLAAYVVVRDAKAVTLGDLREFLKQRLPQTMVPSAFSVLDELPLTANGKLDRRRLVEAQSARERHLAELLERVEKLTPEEARAMLASIT